MAVLVAALLISGVLVVEAVRTGTSQPRAAVAASTAATVATHYGSADTIEHQSVANGDVTAANHFGSADAVEDRARTTNGEDEPTPNLNGSADAIEHRHDG